MNQRQFDIPWHSPNKRWEAALALINLVLSVSYHHKSWQSPLLKCHAAAGELDHEDQAEAERGHGSPQSCNCCWLWGPGVPAPTLHCWQHNVNNNKHTPSPCCCCCNNQSEQRGERHGRQLSQFTIKQIALVLCLLAAMLAIRCDCSFGLSNFNVSLFQLT